MMKEIRIAEQVGYLFRVEITEDNGDKSYETLTKEGVKSLREVIELTKVLPGSAGQIAYEAYCDSAGWRSTVTGSMLPPWRNLIKMTKDAWEAAAEAVKVTTKKEIVNPSESLLSALSSSQPAGKADGRMTCAGFVPDGSRVFVRGLSVVSHPGETDEYMSRVTGIKIGSGEFVLDDEGSVVARPWSGVK